MKWRAWYADGRRFTSRDCEVAGLPREGLVIVVDYLEPPYKNIYNGADWIWHRAGKWGTAMSEFDARVYGDYVWEGVQMPDAEFERVQSEAMESVWP